MLASLVAMAGLVAIAPPAVAAIGDAISGSIWQDYDSDGVFDTFETGLEGIEVYAYDSDGNSAGPAQTGADGSYSLPVTSNAVQWRVEANVPDDPEWDQWRDTAHGADNLSTVQFVTSVPAADVNFSFQVPSAYVENNPGVYIPVIRYGAYDGAEASSFAGAVQDYDAVSPNPSTVVPSTMHVPFADIGATNGSAWQRPTNLGDDGELFTAAYYRRHAGFGPGGIGAIYQVTPDGADLSSPTGSGSLYVDVAAHGIDVGQESDPGAVAGPVGLRPRTTADNLTYDWMRDAQAWDGVGRAGLGGIAFSTDEKSLFAVNLHNRSLIKIDTGLPATTPTNVTEIELDQYFSDSSDLRPYGVSANPLTNEMYLTVTNTAESSGDPADLHGYVYRFTPDDPGNLEEVLDFPLGFTRGIGHTGGGGADGSLDWSGDYHPWSLDTADFTEQDNYMAQAVPVVSDAKYLHGNLVIGIRDLTGDLFGSQTYLSPDPADTELTTIRSVGGDMYLAEPNDQGTWTFEQNGVVNGVKGAGSATPIKSPTGDKYFNDRWDVLGAAIDLQALGSFVVVPSRDDGILSTALHAANGGGQAGTRRFYQATGANFLPSGALLRGTGGVDATFKGNGLGSMSIMASAAPIEIGNYIWYDVDRDGIQDADETPVVGTTVRLYAADQNGDRTGVPIATTTTDANGQYYFTSTDEGLLPNTRYVIGVDLAADYASGGVLEDWVPTVADTGDQDSVDPNRNDSDGIVDEGNGFPYISLTTGGLGENDHTFDFGYYKWTPALDKELVSAVENPDDDGTWLLTYRLTVTNEGPSWGVYDLSDDLTQMGEGIVLEDVTTAGPQGIQLPDGVELNPDYDGVDDKSIIENVRIDGPTPGGAAVTHVYDVTTTVSLEADESGEVTVPVENLACQPADGGFDPDSGGYNLATLHPEDKDDLTDEECASFPKVVVDKELVGEPTHVDGDPGLWSVNYEVTVTNQTDVATDYDLNDTLKFGAGMTIEGTPVITNTAPGGVVPRPEWNGTSDVLVIEDTPIAGDEVQTWSVTVQYRLDLASVPAEPVSSDCAVADGEQGTGLTNDTDISYNGYRDYADACGETGEPAIDKTLVSAEHLGNGEYRIVYGLDVTNLGAGVTQYNLDDELRFDPKITVDSADVSTSPDGVTLAEPAWDGVDDQRIATGVELLGKDDDGYAAHHYEVTVTAQVPAGYLASGGTLACGDAGLTGDGREAFNNYAELGLVDERTKSDRECPPLQVGDPTLDKKVLLPGETLDNAGQVTDTLYDKDGKPTPRTVKPGDTIQYGIVVKGNPDFGSTKVSVDDALPAGVIFTGDYQASQGSYDGMVWTIGNIDAGQVVTLVLDVKVQPVEDGKIITNTAQLNANGKKITDDGKRKGRNTDPTDGWDAVDIIVISPPAAGDAGDESDTGNSPDTGGLPDTGAPVVLAPLLAGLIMIVGGLGLVTIRRRRLAALNGQSTGNDGLL